MVYLEEGCVGVYVDQKKWEKTRSNLFWIKEQVDKCQGPADVIRGDDFGINYKELEKRRGFLVYVSRTYPSMVPYLKGIHQTLDGWRPGRDNDGWKLTHAEIKAAKDHNYEMGYVYPKDIPKYVYPCTRLDDDLDCLLKLFESEYPKVRHVRSSNVYLALYGFADASGSGFGSTIQTDQGLRVRHSVWGRDATSSSSNFKELSNLVDTIEKEVESGVLFASEFFIFTDNLVAERCYHKGTSHSRVLFNLVLRLRKAEMKAGMKLHVTHVAGTRMIAQGMDGVSRGNYLKGVMMGTNMLQFIPFNQSALERSDNSLTWVQSWAPPSGLRVLKPQDWYELGHGLIGGTNNLDNVWTPQYSQKCNLWVPSPAVAGNAMEELI